MLEKEFNSWLIIFFLQNFTSDLEAAVETVGRESYETRSSWAKVWIEQ
jgi:hypothetical protein